MITPSAGSDTRRGESNSYKSRRERGSAIWAEKCLEIRPDRSQPGPCPCRSVAYLSQQTSLSFERQWDHVVKQFIWTPKTRVLVLSKSFNFGLDLNGPPQGTVPWEALYQYTIFHCTQFKNRRNLKQALRNPKVLEL